MKKFWLGALVILGACAGNGEEGNNTSSRKVYPQQDIVEVEMNGTVVYGVTVRDSSGENTSRGYEITLKLNNQVWIDTLYLELNNKEMVQGEIIFGDAAVNDMGGATVEMRRFDIR